MIVVLKTPQAKVHQTVEFWLAFLRAKSRRASSSQLTSTLANQILLMLFPMHFWDLLFSLFCLAVIDWKISFNLDFVVQKLDGASHANYETKKTPARATMLRAPFFF